MKKTDQRNAKTFEIITPNEIMWKFWFLRWFHRQLSRITQIGNAFKVIFTYVSENHENIYVNITADVWKNGPPTKMKMNIAGDMRTFYWFSLKTHSFYWSHRFGVPTGSESHEETLEPLTLFGEIIRKVFQEVFQEVF